MTPLAKNTRNLVSSVALFAVGIVLIYFGVVSYVDRTLVKSNATKARCAPYSHETSFTRNDIVFVVCGDDSIRPLELVEESAREH